ncbi:MAG: VOC family protein, partial [Abitibacteriaceae bacterium]|nr:VOC family protein [Abditibacteriaceae bacterium]
MTKTIAGIHHVTAIASDPQQNLDFYAGVLGLRLVKITINFDDPGSYHFYYGDALGQPGSVLTFFPWPGAQRGRIGTSQVSVTSFSVPQSSFSYWQDRLKEHGVQTDASTRFGEPVLSFTDGDGLWLELIGAATPDERLAWSGGPVPGEHAIRGFHSATLSEEGYERTAKLLTETMGLHLLQEEGNRFRYAAGDGGPGA